MATDEMRVMSCMVTFINNKGTQVGQHEVFVTVDTNIMFLIWRLRIKYNMPENIVRAVVDIAL